MFNQKLLSLRDSKDLTQKEIASILKVMRTTYSSWENEAVIIPLKHLNNLCNYYSVPMDYVLGLSNSKNNINIKKIKIINKKIVGCNIKEIRINNNLTIRDLAKILNTTPSTIFSYEKGNTLILTSFAYQICKHFHLSLDWLCGRSNIKELEKRKEPQH